MMSEPVKWWNAVPIGATLTQINHGGGLATFEYRNLKGKTTITVDLFTDEVIHTFTSI